MLMLQFISGRLITKDVIHDLGLKWMTTRNAHRENREGSRILLSFRNRIKVHKD